MTEHLFKPLPIRYQGLYADDHLVDGQQFGTSIVGASRVANSLCRLLFFEQVTVDARLHQIRFYVGPSRENGLLQEFFAVLVNGQLPIFAGVLPTVAKRFIELAFEAIINVVLKKKAESSAAVEAMHDLALRHNEFAREVHSGHMQDKVWLQNMIDHLAIENRAPLRDLPDPVGKSVRQMLIGSGSPPTRIDEVSAAVLRSRDDLEVTEPGEFTAFFDGVFKTNGDCRVRIGDDQRVVRGKIVDPALGTPHNTYTIALDQGLPVVITAKATLKGGEIDRLFISHAAIKT